jgi:hypothetical protein
VGERDPHFAARITRNGERYDARFMDMRSFVAMVCAFGCACAGSNPRSVVISAPVAPTSVIASPVREDPVPPNAVRIVASADGSWARTFPREKNFETIDVPAARSMLLDFRIGASHPWKTLAPDEDYAANYVASLALAVGGREISFGEISGSAHPPSLTYCARLGWHDEEGNVPTFAPSVVSAISIGVIQGDTEIMIVRDGSTLHVLHRETSDGRCDEAKQGPLDVCEGFEWHVRADVRLATNPVIYERVMEVAAPFDCGSPMMDGSKLVAPN